MSREGPSAVEAPSILPVSPESSLHQPRNRYGLIAKSEFRDVQSALDPFLASEGELTRL